MSDILPSPASSSALSNDNRNPFEDTVSPMQSAADSPAALTDNSLILIIDRNATLTIGTDSLVVLNEALRHRRQHSNCFGLFPQLTKTTQAIPFHNILWAELEDLTITIKYAQPVGRGGKSCRVGYIHFLLVDKTVYTHAKQWIETLLDRAYPTGVKRRKRIRVLINPFGGQGYAPSIWSRQVEPIFAAARCEVNAEKTAHRGHAAEIAEALDADAYDVIASASGDGLPHEVINGLAKQKRPLHALRSVAVAQIPCGSGNAMSLNTLGTSNPSWAALEIVKGLPMPLDLMAITQGDKKFYSFLSQAVGIIAESDLGTESLRWMGDLRFTWGVLVRIFGKTIYPAEVSVATEVEDKKQIKSDFRAALTERLSSVPPKRDEPTDDALPALRYGTINDAMPSAFTTTDYSNLGNFYAGNMPLMAAGVYFFPTALPNDGLFDLVTIPGDVSRLEAVKIVATVETAGFVEFPEVEYRKITGYRIVPRVEGGAFAANRGFRAKLVQWLGGAGDQTEGLIAIDGEQVPFEPFQAEVHKGLATVISRCGVAYEVRPEGF